MEVSKTRVAVLAADQGFYDAFAAADMDAMTEIWRINGPLAVDHPCAARIMGRSDVLTSRRAILRAPPPNVFAVEDAIADERQWALISQEDLGQAVIRMVNVFHSEHGAWKMIYHGPAPRRWLSS